MRDQLPATVAVRFRAPGEAPLLRHGDAVLAQAVVKEQFGEFAYRHVGGRDLDLDPAWERDHIVEVDLPLLGRLRCHRAIVGELRAALLELERANLGYVVTPEGVAGCFVPRLISPDGGLSRHAWGIAIDLNWPKNLQGELGNAGRAPCRSTRRPRLCVGWSVARTRPRGLRVGRRESKLVRAVNGARVSRHAVHAAAHRPGRCAEPDRLRRALHDVHRAEPHVRRARLLRRALRPLPRRVRAGRRRHRDRRPGAGAPDHGVPDAQQRGGVGSGVRAAPRGASASRSRSTARSRSCSSRTTAA